MTPLSTPDILQLDDHRARRRQRLGLAEAFHAVDERRRSLVTHLSEVAGLVSADRVSTLWVDEYGPGIAHPHVVVDLLSDRPRRSFPQDPLKAARENGVPGVHEHRGAAVSGPSGGSGGWGLVVSLGSDGTRSWFLVADSVSVRPALSEDQRDEVMFLAGECSAVLLHQDLDGTEGGEQRFPGWHVLRDLEGRDEEDPEGNRIALRFVVARLPILLVEDGLSAPDDRRREQARRAREELLVRRDGHVPGREEELWDGLLDAFEEGALPRLSRELLAWGLEVESQGHLHGAGELLSTAYEVAVGVGEVETAVDAARMAGRTARRRGQWAEAHGWYAVARGVALAAGLPDRAAVVMDGVATTHRERGNLPAARRSLEQALGFAEESGDAGARGRVHHGFLGLEQAAGNLDAAVQHGWRAVSLYEDDGDRTRGLAGLAALFQEMERLDAAEDAWMLVRHLSAEEYYRLYAADALSHLAALRGDAATFAVRAAESDALGWASGPAGAKVEILLHRGLSHQALGQEDEARRWLERTVAFAEEAGFARALFQAEEALESLGSDEPCPPPARGRAEPSPEATEVVAGLHAMRCELVGSPA